MAKGDYYFPLYYKRLLASTVGWKDDEFGAYLKLLIFQFDNGSLPNDLKELKRIAPSIQKHWPLISPKFRKTEEGRLVNDVMLEVYEDVQKMKEKNSLNGKKGGRPKKSGGFDLGKPNETQTKAIPIINNQQSKEEENTIFTIEHCLAVALNDDRWVRANRTNEKELKEFNSLLERRGTYKKNPGDYKNHFANWKNTGKKEITQEEATNSNYRLKKIS